MRATVDALQINQQPAIFGRLRPEGVEGYHDIPAAVLRAEGYRRKWEAWCHRATLASLQGRAIALSATSRCHAYHGLLSIVQPTLLAAVGKISPINAVNYPSPASPPSTPGIVDKIPACLGRSKVETHMLNHLLGGFLLRDSPLAAIVHPSHTHPLSCGRMSSCHSGLWICQVTDR